MAVVTPTLDAAVLAALCATTSWTSGRQVHIRGGAGSSDGVRRVLARLVDQGIVQAQHHPHATLYRLNRDHVAADAIAQLTMLRQVIIDRIVDHLSGWSPAPEHASLFGSFARGDASTGSDIDLLIVLPTGTPAEQRVDRVHQLAQAILRWTGNPAHILDLDHARLVELTTGSDPLIASWRASHVHLTGARLSELLRTAMPHPTAQ